MAGEGFSREERAAMKARAAELKAEARAESAAKKAAAAEQDVLAAIAEMTPEDRAIAETLHAVVKEHAPQLGIRTWYGMPAYTRDGDVVVFFKAASKFDVRYAEVGFNESAQLDEGEMWPTVFAVTAMNATIEQRLVDLVTKAVG